MNYIFEGHETASDESGKGDFFGGIVVCSVNITKELFDKLGENNLLSEIKDSKKLTDLKIQSLAPELMKVLEGNYQVVNVNSEKYNKIYRVVKNQNILLTLCHNRAWKKLQNICEISPEKRVIDKYCEKKDYVRYLTGVKDVYKTEIVDIQIFEYRSESKYISCAIASIIARYYFISQLACLSVRINVPLPLGNSYETQNSVIDAYYNVVNSGRLSEEALRNIYKNHFKTVEKIAAHIYKD